MNVTALCDKLPLDPEPPVALPVEDLLGRRGVVHLIPVKGSDKGRVILVWDDLEDDATLTLFTWDGTKIIWHPWGPDDTSKHEIIVSLKFIDVWVEGWDEDPFDLDGPPTPKTLTSGETFKRLYGGGA